MFSSKRFTFIVFGMAFLFIGVWNFGIGTPVVHAGTTIIVDRTDDPYPVSVACTSTPNDCSLRGAISYANSHPGTVINLTYGTTYTLTASAGYLDIWQDTTIYPTGSCSLFCYATIQGASGWDDRILTIESGANVQISQVIIKNGNVTGTGGGIQNNGNLTLNIVTLRDNTSTSNGGGIANSGNLTITLGIFLSNTVSSTMWGGALESGSGIVNITNSYFSYNSAGVGGAIYISNGSATLRDTNVVTNTATYGGGGGISASAPLTITGGTINGNITNSTIDGGGGLTVGSTGTTNISGTVFASNQATSTGGGGIRCLYGTLNLTNVTVDGNTANDGGGIDSGCDTLTITGGTFNNNKNMGVEIASGNLSMSGTTVNGNTTTLIGAGLYLYTTASTISSSTISNNTSANPNCEGGGIYLNGGALTVNTTTIVSNTLSGTNALGGGIFVGDGTFLTLTNSAIISNTAGQAGGGLEILGSPTVTATAIVKNTTISGNTATSSGGGIMGLYNASILLSNVTVSNNQALYGGGISAASTQVKNTLIAGNISPNGPDCWTTLTSLGYNLLGSNSHCSGLINGVNGDQVGTGLAPIDPKLGRLGNNGGATLTHALLFGSPAINAGNPGTPDGTGNHCAITDQRGVARSMHLPCDIGAFEYNYLRLYLPLIMR